MTESLNKEYKQIFKMILTINEKKKKYFKMSFKEKRCIAYQDVGIFILLFANDKLENSKRNM